MKASLRVAFCGLSAALCMVVLFFTGVVPVATFALPALAGVLLIPVTAQLNIRWGLGVYALCALLALFIVPDREAAVYFVLFFGYYPVIVAALGRIKNRVLQYVVKFALFNAAVGVSAVVLLVIMSIPMEELPFIGVYTGAVLLILANIMFILYDLCLYKVINLYYARVHGKLRRSLGQKWL